MDFSSNALRTPAEQKVSVFFPGNTPEENPPSEMVNVREVLFAYLLNGSYRRDGRPG